MNTRRLIKKKPAYQIESQSLQQTLIKDLSLNPDFGLEMYVIYDIFNADANDIALLEENVIAEPAVDEVLETVDTTGKHVLAFEYLPGQYDQRADIQRPAHACRWYRLFLTLHQPPVQQ